MSKRKDKNPHGKIQHQERMAATMAQSVLNAAAAVASAEATEAFAPLPPQEVLGISSPKLVNRPKFRGNCPKMRLLVYRPNQQVFMDTLQKPDTKIVVLTGPAGTGKTLLAVRKGLEGVLNGRFADLVLCRPLVEAGGEEMGYLPGSVDDKIGPYLEPFYDKLTAFLPEPVLKGLLVAKHITATPLAFMRGRTFSESVVIVDEAQNTTVEQIKMVVTRLGPFSKMVISGDPDQSDIRGMNGLQYLTAVFDKEGVKASEHGCHLCRLGVEDIQRNSVIPYLLDAFVQYRSMVATKPDMAAHSHEARLASLLERTLNHLIGQQEARAAMKPRPSRSRNRLALQGDLFERAQSAVLDN